MLPFQSVLNFSPCLEADSLGDDGFVGEVAARRSGFLGFHFDRFHHVFFEDGHDLIRALLYAALPDGVSRQRDKSVGHSGHIHFQTDFAVIDVIAAFIVCQAGCLENDMDAGTGWTELGVAVHGIHDVLRHACQLAACDAMVDVDSAKAVKHAHAESVITGQGIYHEAEI
jgi:hypothetical protein